MIGKWISQIPAASQLETMWLKWFSQEVVEEHLFDIYLV